MCFLPRMRRQDRREEAPIYSGLASETKPEGGLSI
jgi:hypothetical protein